MFSKAAKCQRKINTDTLQDVFELIIAPVQDVGHASIPSNYGDGKVQK